MLCISLSVVKQFLLKSKISSNKNEDIEFVNGIEALNVIMALAPNVLEGKRGKYRKNAWAVHNLIGHPLMQILSWLSLKEAAVKVHDLTIPNLEEEQ